MLLSMAWAQRQVRQVPYNHLSPALRKEISQMKRAFYPLPPSESGRVGAPSSQARTQGIWPGMPPHLDKDTIGTSQRAINQGIVDPQAGDTIIARVGSPQEDTTLPSSAQFKPYFDSLNARGSYGINFNLLADRGTPIDLNGDNTPDATLYDGNALATRFEIPDTSAPFAIVGLGFHLYNNFGITPRDCDLSTTQEGSPDFSNGNGTYDLIIQLRGIAYDSFADTARHDRNEDGTFEDTVVVQRIYTYPSDTLWETAVPVTQVRVSWFAATTGQCWGAAGGSWRTNMSTARFNSPYVVTPGDTFYAVVASELYDPDLDLSGIQDSLYLRLGPNYPDGHPNVGYWVYDTLLSANNNPVVLNPNVYAPKPEGQSAWNLLIRDNATGAFVAETWVSVTWTNWGSGFQRLRSFHYGIYPIVTEDLTTTSVPAVLRSGEVTFWAPYPNPATDCIHFKAQVPHAVEARLLLTNAMGQVVYEGTRSLQAGEQVVSLDLPPVSGGVYTLHVITPVGSAGFLVQVLR